MDIFKINTRILALCIIACVWTTDGIARSHYVATTGSDTNGGTAAQPFATVGKAAGLAAPGDSIWVRGGVYAAAATIKIAKNGTSALPIVMRVYPGDERPVLDFSAMPIASANQGVILSGSYWHITGIRIKGAGDNGLQLNGGGNNTIEFCEFFENRDAGLQLKNGTHDNRIINCDAYYNADYVSGSSTYVGGNADGFSPKLDCGTGNSFYGCRAWLNSDDGWDGLLSSDLNISTTIENCWSWANGYLKDGKTTTSSMNGNGFKTGGGWTTDASGVKHYTFRHNTSLTNCLSFNNKSKGFDQNHNMGSITLLNCTAQGNTGNNFDIAEALPSGSALTVKNCLSYESTKVKLLNSAVTASNSWSAGFGVTARDIRSLDTAGVSGVRKADGSLPDIAYMHLAPGSPLIDAGTNIGAAFNGLAPDIGCFETPGSTGIRTTDAPAPSGFHLLQNYPNPCNPSTSIAFGIPRDAVVSIKIFSPLGQEVATVTDGAYAPGVHTVVFDASHLCSGMYWYRMQAGSATAVKHMVVLK